MSRKSALQMNVRLVCSAIFVRRSLPARLPHVCGPRPPWGSILPRQGSAGTGKLVEYQTITTPQLSPRTEIPRTNMPVSQEQAHNALKQILRPNKGKDFIAS